MLGRLVFSMMLAIGATIMAPRAAMAQAHTCDEECWHITQEGEEIGHACVGGDQLYDCVATVAECGGMTCENQTFLLDEAGATVALADLCSGSLGVVATRTSGLLRSTATLRVLAMVPEAWTGD